MWEDFSSLAEEHAGKWMIWESVPTEASVARLAEMGIQSTVYNPCGNVPASGDFFTEMARNVDMLARALKK